MSFVLAFSSAVDNRTGSKVAIKKLYRPFQSELFAKRAYRELRLLKHMKHENVNLKAYLTCEIFMVRVKYRMCAAFFLSPGDWPVRCLHR